MGRLGIVEGTGGTARRTRRAAAAVATRAARHGWAPTEVELAALADRSGELDRVVLCGGDGLVHRAVQALAGTQVEVAVVPVGTGNDFARAFRLDPRQAVAVASAAPGGETRATDLLTIEGVYAASVLTGGYSGRVNATANTMRFPPGSAKYTIAALREIERLQARQVRLELTAADGRVDTLDGPTTLFAIGNTAYFGGGMQICPAADPTDGQLDIVRVGPLGRASLVAWLPKVFSGRHLAHPAVEVRRATSVTIETTEALWADGEPVPRTGGPVTVGVARGALRLVVPDR